MNITDLFLRPWNQTRDLVRRPPQPLSLIVGGPNAPELCCRPLDYQGHHHPRRAYAEVKLDGIRCLMIDGRLVTLEGQPFNAALHCMGGLEELERLYGEAMMFDAEYVEDGGFDQTLSAFKAGQGTGTLWVFDAVPMREWVRDTSQTPWHERKRVLNERIMMLDCPWVGGLAAKAVPTEACAKAKFTELRRLGFEGLVVKDADAPYSRARCNAWQRMKPAETIDLQLVEICGDDSRGARKLICRDRAGPVTLTAGWNRDVAMSIWKNRNRLVGIGVEVTFSGRTQQGRLRHPRFSRLRLDRTSITL